MYNHKILLTSHLITLLALIIQFQGVSASKIIPSNNYSCPVWTVPKLIESGDGNYQCTCGDNLNSAVLCDSSTLDISVLLCHCMSFSEAFNKTVVGHCLYNFFGDQPPQHNYGKVKSLEDRNNNDLCKFIETCYYRANCTIYQHQTGLMCTSCIDEYAFPVYSYNIACVECKNYKYNWLMYIAVAFLPLTLFYFIIVLFRITVTSGIMNGYILMCQIVAIPMNIRLASRLNIGPSKTTVYGTQVFFAIISIWNLDFFRGVYAPFCLHPDLSTLQTLMLDYLIAVYPLLLIVVTYTFVKLHSRFSLIVWLWSPFHKCFAKFRNNWNVNRSLVGVFATFILLSYVKILNVSFYVLTPNTFYDAEGNIMQKRFLYYDGSYEYFGSNHIPYAVVAMFMLLVFNVLPLVLLCLYPCRCFQRCLNYCRLRSLALHIFMDTLNGCYKSKPRDCRYFAAIYVFLRLLNHILLSWTLDPSYLPLAGIMAIVMIALVAILRPHKSALHTVIDTVFFLSLSILFLGLSAYRLVEQYDKHYHRLFLLSLTVFVGSVPFVYGNGLIIYFILPKMIFHKMKLLFEHYIIVIRRTESNVARLESPLPHRLECSEEYPPLLPVTANQN